VLIEMTKRARGSEQARSFRQLRHATARVDLTARRFRTFEDAPIQARTGSRVVGRIPTARAATLRPGPVRPPKVWRQVARLPGLPAHRVATSACGAKARLPKPAPFHVARPRPLRRPCREAWDAAVRRVPDGLAPRTAPPRRPPRSTGDGSTAPWAATSRAGATGPCRT